MNNQLNKMGKFILSYLKYLNDQNQVLYTSQRSIHWGEGGAKEESFLIKWQIFLRQTYQQIL